MYVPLIKQSLSLKDVAKDLLPLMGKLYVYRRAVYLVEEKPANPLADGRFLYDCVKLSKFLTGGGLKEVPSDSGTYNTIYEVIMHGLHPTLFSMENSFEIGDKVRCLKNSSLQTNQGTEGTGNSTSTSTSTSTYFLDTAGYSTFRLITNDIKYTNKPAIIISEIVWEVKDVITKDIYLLTPAGRSTDVSIEDIIIHAALICKNTHLIPFIT